MSSPANVVLSLAGAAIVPAVLLLGKVAGLRDASFSKWSNRVDLAHSGLTERAVDLLRRLQSETNDLLGEPHDFDPSRALADPAPLVGVTRNFEKTMKVRSKLRRRFSLLLAISIAAPVLLVMYVSGAVAVTVYYLEWWSPDLLPEAGFVVATFALGAAFVLVLVYFYLEWRLTTADMKSRPAGSSAKKRI